MLRSRAGVVSCVNIVVTTTISFTLCFLDIALGRLVLQLRE
jgi:hypothetical protein